MTEIKAIFFDCDGVFTDGKITFDAEGREMRTYDMQDGMGVTLLRQAGIFVAVMSSSYGGSIEKRMEMLKVEHCYTSVPNKADLIREVCAAEGLSLEQVAFVGDDLVDVPPMEIVGIPIAVANAVPAVKKVAQYITTRPGGDGAIREIAENIVGEQRTFIGAAQQ